MKNLKKMVSGLLTVTMLLTSVVTGFAAAKGDCTTQKWTISNYGTLPEGFILGENVYVEPTAEESYGEGKFSMHFYHEADATTGAGSFVLRILESLTVGVGTYDISFYTKGTITNPWTLVGIEAKGGNAALNNSAWTVTEAEDGWTKYEAQFTTTAAGNKVLFRTSGDADFYLDNFEVCPVIDGVKGADILSNGDFENSTQTLPVEPEDPAEKVAPEEKYITEIWQEQYVGVSADYTAEKDIFAEPTTAESFEGEYSMHMVHPGSMTSTENDGYVRIMDVKKVNNAGAITAGTYYISFYLKGKVSEGWTAAGVSDLTLNNSAWTKTPANNGWTKYEAEITTTSNSDRVRLRTYGDSDFYIDNFVVCPVTNGVKGDNILANGGFENTRKAAAGLINPVVYPSVDGVSAILSWRNPNYGSVVSVEAVLNGGGFEDQELDLGTLILTTGGNVGTTRTNTCSIKGLNPDTDYVLTLNTEISQNSVTTKYTTDIVFTTTTENAYSTIDGKSAGRWVLAKQQTDSAYMNAIPAIDTDVKYSGNSSLRIDANMFNRVGNIYAPVTQSLTLERNKLYILKAKVKSAGVHQFKAMVQGTSVGEIDGAVRNWAYQDYLINETSSYYFSDWKEYEFNLSTTNADGYELFSESVETADEIKTKITIFPEMMCGSLWIDDVAVYEIDADDEIISGNLLKDGGMEFISGEITTSFTDENGDELKSIKAGTVNVTSSIKNTSLGNQYNVATVIALYNGTVLENVWMKEGIIAETADSIPAETWTQAVTVPDDGNKYTIKVMYWNSSSEMSPIEALEELK